MSPALLEPAALTLLTAGAAAILRFVWLDSGRFSELGARGTETAVLTPATTRRLAVQAEADRVAAEIAALPRAA